MINNAQSTLIGKIRDMRFSEKIQLVIWVLSIIGVAVYYSTILSGLNVSELGFTMAIIFGVTTLIQQFLIYIDIYEIENNSDDLANEYGRWINHGLEKFFRYILFFSLLLCAGKISSSIEFLIPAETDNTFFAFFGSLIKHRGSKHIYLFFWGGLLVFFCQFFWNVLALYLGKEGINHSSELRPWLIKSRIIFFSISAFLAFIYWLFLLVNPDIIADYSLGVVGLYLLFTILGTLLKWRKTALYINAKLT